MEDAYCGSLSYNGNHTKQSTMQQSNRLGKPTDTIWINYMMGKKASLTLAPRWGKGGRRGEAQWPRHVPWRGLGGRRAWRRRRAPCGRWLRAPARAAATQSWTVSSPALRTAQLVPPVVAPRPSPLATMARGRVGLVLGGSTCLSTAPSLSPGFGFCFRLSPVPIPVSCAAFEGWAFGHLDFSGGSCC
jgi:hypothetical protein